MNNSLVILGAILVFVNLFSFVLVGVDKRKSLNGAERIPEAWLFFIAVFFASAGVFLGMLAFRHKIRKAYFPIGIGLMLLEQAALVFMLLNKISLLN
jgi:uncharacterized membrane protein YsdA (DUF1294 family)